MAQQRAYCIGRPSLNRSTSSMTMHRCVCSTTSPLLFDLVCLDHCNASATATAQCQPASYTDWHSNGLKPRVRPFRSRVAITVRILTLSSGWQVDFFLEVRAIANRIQEQCCRYQAIVPLSTVMTALAQQARALTCIDILRIDVLQQELPNLISGIQVNSIGPSEVRELFRSRRDVPAIILDTVCQSIATRFATGILSFCALDNWYEVADRHRRFDSGVKHCLRALESQHRYSGNYETLENTSRVWIGRSVNRYERHLTRRSFERKRRRSHGVSDLFVGQRDRYNRAVGDVFIEAYQPPPSVYSWPRQPFQPAWISQQQPNTPPHTYPSERNLFEPLRPQHSYHDPQPPWQTVSPNGVAPPMPFRTPQMHHTVHHFHHSSRNRTPPQRPSYSNSRYHYQHGPSYRRHSQDHHRWHRMRWSGGVRSVDD